MVELAIEFLYVAGDSVQLLVHLVDLPRGPGADSEVQKPDAKVRGSERDLDTLRRGRAELDQLPRRTASLNALLEGRRRCSRENVGHHVATGEVARPKTSVL